MEEGQNQVEIEAKAEDDPKKEFSGRQFQTDREAMSRNAICSDGTFARKEFYLVANDVISKGIGREDLAAGGVVLKNIEDTMIEEVLKRNGDTTFCRLADHELKRDMYNAVNSSKGYSSRYCQSRNAWRDRCKTRFGGLVFNPSAPLGKEMMELEAGGFVPVRVKLIALPPPDEIADSSDSYNEYVMKCSLRGVSPAMSEREFLVYKY